MSYKYHRKRPPISEINYTIQGHLQGQFQGQVNENIIFEQI